MPASEPITLSRACEVIEIPSGIRDTLPAGTVVRIMQSLGSGYTVATDRGYMYRIDAKDTESMPRIQMPWGSPTRRRHKHPQSRRGPSAIKWSGIS
jgi:hypothetical protein